jgi:hypothetical protein
VQRFSGKTRTWTHPVTTRWRGTSGWLFKMSRSGYRPRPTRPPSSRSMASANPDAQAVSRGAASDRSRIVRGLLRSQGLQRGHEPVPKSLRRQGLRRECKGPYHSTADSSGHKPVAANGSGSGHPLPWQATQPGVNHRHRIRCHRKGVAVSRRNRESGAPAHQGLVDGRTVPSRAGLQRAALGMLATRSDAVSPDALRSRHSWLGLFRRAFRTYQTLGWQFSRSHLRAPWRSPI